MLRNILAYSKLSKLSNRHPLEKILLCIGTIITLGFSTKCYPILINIGFFLLLHIMCKNPMSVVKGFIKATFLFALFSSITFIFDYGIYKTILIILKAVSGGVVVSFLALTTPTDHLFYMGSKVSFLREICDIGKSMERFLILIDDEFRQLNKAMIARGGFGSFKDKIRDSGTLGGLLFINTMYKWKEIKAGINSRCYKGTLHYAEIEFDLSYIRLAFILMYIILLIILISIP